MKPGAIRLLSAALLLTSPTTLRSAERDVARPLAPRERYLLLDNRVVDGQRNARLAVGTVTKSPANPLFAEDRPWEVRFDNLYANILYDEAEQIFKCWYSPFIQDAATKPPMEDWDDFSYADELRKLKGDSARRMGICYATSKDGIHWQKPNLGLVEFDGSTANNLVYGDPHGAGIFKDLIDPDASRRYKMITGEQPHGVLSRSYSADGMHWSELHPIAKVRGDTHNNAFWDPTGKRYVAISRENVDGNRTVVRLESEDFIHWSEAREILRGPKTAQTYAMPVTFYHGVFIGLIAVFHTQEDRVSTELAWSPDTVNWHRIDEGTPLIPLADQVGEYDWGCAYAAASPVIMPDGAIRIYYGASNGKHTSWRDGYLALATLRPNTWAGYEPIDSSAPAVIKTTRLAYSGGMLKITADLGGNTIGVKVLADDDRILAEGKSLSNRAGDIPIEWAHGFNLDQLKGQAIRIEFNFQSGRLYSFSFDQ